MSGHEPAAIVGMGCRFGTIASLDEFWKLLRDGRSAFAEIPADRFPLEKYHDPRPGTRGRVVTREGAYFDDVRGFDARFFRISPREAAMMDPQQRILLESAWNALQDAGMGFAQVDGERAGVFVGLFTGDYRERILKSPDFDYDVYSEIGSTRSSAAGRIAYAFNLTGPTVAVDAACASSLVAVHLACQSIWSGETAFALAGGCNVILEPETTVCFSRSKMLSPRSRCRFGDATADGFVRSEGVGVVVLKPLSRAVLDGDRIYAVVRATGCNNDARQGGGLYMTPSRDGQRSLLKQVYLENGLNLDRLAYVEAHGTGTRAGDPVECGAIAAVLGSKRRADTPLYVGSVKTNVGHTEGAAGIAAFIKTALSLHHRTLPASLHFETPNPDIPWEAGRLAVPTSSVDLSDRGDVLAGVSSFGLSGTNAHAVLETWPAGEAALSPAKGERAASEGYVLPLSAHMPSALRQQARLFRDRLKGLGAPGQPSLGDLCFTAAVRRSHLEHRLAVVGATREALIDALAPFTEEGAEDAIVEPPACRPVFVFSGQGGQWAGMGRALMGLEPAFRRALERIDAIFVAQEGWSVLAELCDEGTTWGTDIARIQPLIFALQVALADLWRAYGVTPAAVVGHSMGEVAAACVAGAIRLEHAVRVICARSACLARIRGQGRMAVVGLGIDDAARALQGYEDRVAIAVSNGRSSTVLSGDPAALDEILAALTARDVYCSRVDVDVASHSPQVDPLLEDLRRQVAHCLPRAGETAFYSTVDADVRPGERIDADYWAANMRQAVRFGETTRRLLADGHDLFVEMSPHPVLLNPLLQTLREEEAKAIAVAPMRRDEADRSTLLNALAAVYMHGYNVRWATLYPAGRVVSLPDYPFQHEAYWFTEEAAGEVGPLEQLSIRRTSSGAKSHPLLPRFFRPGATPDTAFWEVPLSTKRFPWLADHRVRGSALLPGAAFVEIGLAAAAERFSDAPIVLEDIELRDYLAVPIGRERTLQVQLTQLGASAAELRFYSFEDSDADEKSARLHAVMRVRLEAAPDAAGETDDADAEPHSDTQERPTALLIEQVGIELARARHNPGYRFALMSTFVGEAPDGAPLSQRRLTRRLRALVRQIDLVQPVGPGQFVMLLRQVRDQAALEAVARRLDLQLLEGPEALEQAAGRPVIMLGAVIEPEGADAGRLVRDAMGGRLPVLSPEGTEEDAQLEPEIVSGEAFYAAMNRRGIAYGPTFQPMRRLERRGGASRAELVLPESIQAELAGYRLHPAALDGCFQAAVAAFLESCGAATADDTFLPVGIRRLSIGAKLEGRLFCRAWSRGAAGGREDELEVDFEISDESRRSCFMVEGFRLRLFERRSLLPVQQPWEDWMYHPVWVREEAARQALHKGIKATGTGVPGTPGPNGIVQARGRAAKAPAAVGRWVLVEEAEGEGALLQGQLEALGCAVTRIPVRAIPAGDPERDVGAPVGVVYLCAQPSGVRGDTGAVLMESADRCICALETVKYFTENGAQVGFWLVTVGAVGIDNSVALEQAPLWGLARVIVNERPEIALYRADVLDTASSPEMAALAASMVSPDAEDEIALRGDARFVQRLVRADGSGDRRRIAREVSGDAPLVLAMEARSEGLRLGLRPGARRAPAAGEVQLRVGAAVIEPAAVARGGRFTLGCAGVVTAVGPGGHDLREGDPVMAFVSRIPQDDGTIVERYLNVPQAFVARIPPRSNLAQAAALTATWLPAWLAVHHTGPISAGDRVLIRGAARGVGLAAASLAHAAGARVYVTADRLEDRERLRALGLACVLDEGSDALKEEILDLTGREGIDLALNLPGGAGPADCLAVLSPGGRLVDLDRPADRGRIDLDGAPHSVTYAALDVDALCRRRPALLRDAMRALVRRAGESLLSQMCADVQVGTEWLDPTARIAAERLDPMARVAAERLDPMAAAAGVAATPGFTLAVSLDATAVTVEAPLSAATLFDREATYLVTGGNGGLGQLLARWLSAQGAGHIALLSRSGKGPGLEALEAELRAAGTGVTLLRGDVADAVALEAAFRQIDAEAPPLRGVFHLAGILDDATLEGQSHARFVNAMRPKVQGAWNLHRMTRDRALDHFVLFSSAATTLGSPGQANYAAANAFLDALAQERRRAGLPALSLAWGTWAEAGLAAAREDRAARLESRGLGAMATVDALRALEQAMLGTEAEVVIVQVDWSRWAQSFARTTRAPRLTHLVRAVAPEAGDEAQRLPSRILAADPAERPALLEAYLRQQLADVLRMPVSRLSASTPLGQLGMDSLMTVELRSRLQDRLQVELSPKRILAMPSLAALVDAVAAAMGPMDAADRAGAGAGSPEASSLPMVMLDEAIQARSAAPPVVDPKAVFLTGATGFLGAHLVRELLDRTRARVLCLVRAGSDNEARDRLRESLERHQLWREDDESRLEPVRGDLGLPLFGLSVEAFRSLAASIDAIYHCGAWVNHLYPYSRLEAVNVGGTQEVLRLATLAAPRPVHHVSTLAVLPFTSESGARRYDEESSLQAHCEPFFAGYSESKWMAERLIEQARARGLNVCIYRPGAITGSSRSGICQQTDVIWRMVQAAVSLGAAPRASRGIGLTPVDGVARAMVELSRHGDAVNRVYHLFAERPFPILDAIHCLQAMGYPIQVTGFGEWREKLAGVERGSTLAALLPGLQALDFERIDRMPVVASSRRTLEQLEPETRAGMEVDRALMRRYLLRFVVDAFLPAPARGRLRAHDAAVTAIDAPLETDAV